jgi:hypothetical protein
VQVPSLDTAVGGTYDLRNATVEHVGGVLKVRFYRRADTGDAQGDLAINLAVRRDVIGVHVRACMRVCVSLYVYVCVNVCMRVFLCMCGVERKGSTSSPAAITRVLLRMCMLVCMDACM